MSAQKTLSNWMIKLSENDPSHVSECQILIKDTCEVMINNPIPEEDRNFYKTILALSQFDLNENSAKFQLIQYISLLLDYFFCSSFGAMAPQFEEHLRRNLTKTPSHLTNNKNYLKVPEVESGYASIKVEKSFLEIGETYSFGDTRVKIVDIRNNDLLSLQWITKEGISPQEIADNGIELKIGRNRDVNFRFKYDLRMSKYHAMLGRENGR
mmetsp:Transcript_3381/g.3104  ORF Transcript_3381/g.3104 Transcript_3381/m.3104 type:complete len:211 (+) Transcript_3381:17-649(+)